jgi:hypothetical protein
VVEQVDGDALEEIRVVVRLDTEPRPQEAEQHECVEGRQAPLASREDCREDRLHSHGGRLFLALRRDDIGSIDFTIGTVSRGVARRGERERYTR